MPTTVFFASDRILAGDPTIVSSYGPNIQPPSISTDIMYGTAFVDGVDIKANQQGSIAATRTRTRGHSLRMWSATCQMRAVISSSLSTVSTTPSKTGSRAPPLTGSSSRPREARDRHNGTGFQLAVFGEDRQLSCARCGLPP
jgi:hypothetical protein